MALIEAIEIKRKAFFEFENAPYHCIDVEVSKPTARGGQTLVRIKMRNLLTRAVFDKTFKAGEKFKEPDLVMVPASYLYADGDGHHFLVHEVVAVSVGVQIRRRHHHEVWLLELLAGLEGLVEHGASEQVSHLDAHQRLAASRRRFGNLHVDTVVRSVLELEERLALDFDRLDECHDRLFYWSSGSRRVGFAF